MKNINLYTTVFLSMGLLFSGAIQAGEGVLALTTEPKEAEIYIDGQLKVNTTPVIFRLLEGKYQIEIKSPGKYPKQLEVLIAEDAIISKKVTLLADFPRPEMVIVPAGQFQMGDIQGTGEGDEQPVHLVSVNSFAMSRHEVMFKEYDYFIKQTEREKPSDKGWGRGNRPVINVSWDDAVAYAEWLSQQTGKKYRLPTEAEWEYAARAGTQTYYGWGNVASHEYANYGKEECCGSLVQGKDQWEFTAPVCSFAANSFGLCDMAGNVWEWTCSAYEEKYNGEELKCVGQADNRLLVIRGGGWFNGVRSLRASNRNWLTRATRYNIDMGFRVVRE